MLLTKNATGSIGAGQISYDQNNNRIKGFAGFKIDSMDDLMRLKTQIKAVEAAHPQSDRTTVRALVHKSLVENIIQHPNGYGTVEAVVNIDNATPDYRLVYLGRNMPHRRSEPMVKQSEIEDVENIRATIVPTNKEAARARLENGGYKIVQTSQFEPEVLSQLVSLYQRTYQEYTFEITPQSVSAFASENNIVLVGHASDGSVVSAMVAENAKVKIGDIELNLYELSDYATDRAHRGAGLMTAMQIEAINLIRSMPGGMNAIVYSENRAPWSPVTISSFKTGMGVEYCGTLDKHCALLSDRNFVEPGAFENLHVISYNGYHNGSS